AVRRPMDPFITFTMTDRFITAGIRRMAIEYLKLGAPIAIIFWLAIAIGLVRIGAPQFVQGIWVGILLLATTWSIYLYFHRIKRMREFHEKFSSRQVTLDLGLEGVRVSHELGSSFLPWRIYNHLVRHAEVWFLYRGPYDFVMFPSTAFSREAANFMAERIVACGGKV